MLTTHSSHYNSIYYFTSIYWGEHRNAIVILSLGHTQCGVSAGLEAGKVVGSTWAGLSRRPQDDRHSFSSPECAPTSRSCCTWTSPRPFLAFCAAHVLSALGDPGWCCLLELQEGQGSPALPGMFPRLSFRTSQEGHVASVGWAKEANLLPPAGRVATYSPARDVRSQYSAFSPLPTLEGREGERKKGWGKEVEIAEKWRVNHHF